jgi:hypothetical protein
VPRLNRVDPWGDLHAASGRGLFTGNRGCLVDAGGTVVRHHGSSLWIACVTEFRGWRFPLAAPGRWTPIFFLDDAVALAAGHRPCGLCRREAYRSYRDAVTRWVGSARPLLAHELNRRLAAERHHLGRGLARAGDRRLWTADVDDLPAGTVIVDEVRQEWLLLDDSLSRFTFDGWTEPVERPRGRRVTVLTPPTSVAALVHGYEPVLHPSAAGGPGAN